MSSSVRTAEDHVKHVAQVLLAQLALVGDQPDRERQHHGAVPHVAEHDGEQEREGRDGEHRRVHLPVPRDAVRVHLHLQGCRTSHPAFPTGPCWYRKRCLRDNLTRLQIRSFGN